MHHWRWLCAHINNSILNSGFVIYSFLWHCHVFLAFQVVLVVKNLSANVGDARDESSTPGSRRSLGAGNGNPLQYSCWEDFMGWGGWGATVNRVAELDTTEHTHRHVFIFYFPKQIILPDSKIACQYPLHFFPTISQQKQTQQMISSSISQKKKTWNASASKLHCLLWSLQNACIGVQASLFLSVTKKVGDHFDVWIRPLSLTLLSLSHSLFCTTLCLLSFPVTLLKASSRSSTAFFKSWILLNPHYLQIVFSAFSHLQSLNSLKASSILFPFPLFPITLNPPRSGLLRMFFWKGWREVRCFLNQPFWQNSKQYLVL